MLREQEGAVSRSYSLLALCVVFGALAPGGAYAQADDKATSWKEFDVKPFIPPLLPLPPNAQVNPGTIDQTPWFGDRAPINNPQAPPPASGLRITIPTR
jgi:hypothetical protein